METLLLKTNLMQSEFYLCDSRGYYIGTFNTVTEARQWCIENGYRIRLSF